MLQVYLFSLTTTTQPLGKISEGWEPTRLGQFGWGDGRWMDKVMGRQSSLSVTELFDVRNMGISVCPVPHWGWDIVLVGLFWGLVSSMAIGFSKLLDNWWADECFTVNYGVLTNCDISTQALLTTITPTFCSIHIHSPAPPSLMCIFLSHLYAFRSFRIHLRCPLFPTWTNPGKGYVRRKEKMEWNSNLKSP